MSPFSIALKVHLSAAVIGCASILVKLIREVFTNLHINPLDSNSNLFVWYPYNFLGLDWTGVLSESTGIPVLWTGTHRRALFPPPPFLLGLQLDSTRLHWSPLASARLTG